MATKIRRQSRNPDRVSRIRQLKTQGVTTKPPYAKYHGGFDSLAKPGKFTTTRGQAERTARNKTIAGKIRKLSQAMRRLRRGLI